MQDQTEYELLDWTGRARSLMHGNGADRWFDKSLTVVVHRNGKVGVNAEHAWADAPVIGHLLEVAMIVAEQRTECYEQGGHAKGFRELDTSPSAASDSQSTTNKADDDKCEASACGRDATPSWQRATWALPRGAEDGIAEAHRRARELIDDLDLQVSFVKPDCLTNYYPTVTPFAHGVVFGRWVSKGRIDQAELQESLTFPRWLVSVSVPIYAFLVFFVVVVVALVW